MTAPRLVLRWTNPLPIELPRLGLECQLPPPTRGQMRRYYEIQPDGAEEQTPAQLDQLRAAALAIFCEGTDVPLDQLTADEELELLWAIIALHHGHDPRDAAALAALLKKKALVAALATASGDSPPSTPIPSPSPES